MTLVERPRRPVAGGRRHGGGGGRGGGSGGRYGGWKMSGRCGENCKQSKKPGTVCDAVPVMQLCDVSVSTMAEVVAAAPHALATPILSGTGGGDAPAVAAAADAVATVASTVTNIVIPGVVGDDTTREGFIQALLLILFSELGDKTFFIAILLATQRDRLRVFTGTFGALASMTLISVALGRALHQIDELVPFSVENFDDYLAVALLLFFGVQTLRGAGGGDVAEGEEREAEEAVQGFNAMGGGGAEATLVLSTFALVFAAEWGDKSFLATIALAAASSPAGVVVGAIVGHGIATAIAVLGGSLLGKYVSEKAVAITGGVLFIVFAVATLVDINVVPSS